METLAKELENLAHTLNDIKTSIKCSELLIKSHIELIERLNPRVQLLEGRVDSLAIKIGKKKNGTI